MMPDKRLISMVEGSVKYIAGNILFQWIALLANIAMMYSISGLLASLVSNTEVSMTLTAAAVITAIAVRYICTAGASRMSYLSSKAVKHVLREKIFRKLERLGVSYNESVPTSEVIQVTVEGVDQLETYFGAYIPQFFYAVLAPVTLFIVLSFVSFTSSLVLLICVPLIPVAIAAVQTWAKKLLGRYWGQYTALGDIFLENLQGLTTLKIYQSDAYKHKQMNEEAEKFRVITMKVLTMQLNSITIMDFIAYGGAALGMILAVTQLRAGKIDVAGCLLIILLSADFFIPMRQLGSYFHTAMNGMAACDKIFRLIDLPEDSKGTADFPEGGEIVLKDVCFSYDGEHEVLHDVNIVIQPGSFTAIAGESGCGKSTISGIITGVNAHYTGSACAGGAELHDISEDSLFEHVTYVSNHSYLFKGTVRDNLLAGDADADDAKLWDVLEKVKIAGFLRSEKGLDTLLQERAANLSGGPRQRLALARALLKDTEVYIFDEATSNIDIESENDIMNEIHELARTKTVVLISHRLANAVNADRIYCMDHGVIAEAGTHEELLNMHGTYEKLWNVQKELEQFAKGED